MAMLHITNARVIDPATGYDQISDILIKDGLVVGIGVAQDIQTLLCKYDAEERASSTDSGKQNLDTIDAKGLVASPGLVDTHAHFRDPGLTEKEDLSTGAAAAARGGYTTVLLLDNTKPPIDDVEKLNELYGRALDLPIHVLQNACCTMEMKGQEPVDMAALWQAGAVGFTDDGLPLMNKEVAQQIMKTAAAISNNADATRGLPGNTTSVPDGFPRPVVLSFHEEDPAYIEGAGINKGEVARQLGLKGADRKAETVMVERDCALALQTGARINIQHISAAQSVDILRRYKEQGADIWAEATPHHFSLTEESVRAKGTNARVNPPLRTEADRLAIIEGLKDGTIDMIATDHAPHTEKEKALAFPQAPSGMIGLETALALGMTHLVGPGHLTLPKLIEKMTLSPAICFGLAGPAGILQEGGVADLVLFDPQETWTVNKEEFASKAANSPFVGETLTGRVKYTICGGKIVYQD